MFKLRLLLPAMLLCLLACSARAECYYNGTPHPEGTVIGPYVCKNGQWVNK
jgi:hypothetical protein